jgi:hypothetical protein
MTGEADNRFLLHESCFPVCFLVRVCLGVEFRFDGNIAAPAVGTLGSLGCSRLCVLVVSLECVGCLVILGAVSRVVIVTAPWGFLLLFLGCQSPVLARWSFLVWFPELSLSRLLRGCFGYLWGVSPLACQ